MSLAAVRKIALSGFLFPRHTMPMLTRPFGAKTEPAYHEVCGFVRVSGSGYRAASVFGTVTGPPDLLDVLRASR